MRRPRDTGLTPAYLTLLVPGELLPDANGALRTAQEALRLIAPLAGAGRAYAAADALVTTPQTISIALGAALIGVAGYRTLLTVMAVVTVGAAGYLLSRPQRRHAPARRSQVRPNPGAAR